MRQIIRGFEPLSDEPTRSRIGLYYYLVFSQRFLVTELENLEEKVFDIPIDQAYSPCINGHLITLQYQVCSNLGPLSLSLSFTDWYHSRNNNVCIY